MNQIKVAHSTRVFDMPGVIVSYQAGYAIGLRMALLPNIDRRIRQLLSPI
jgi:hypothetical protein